MSQLWRSAISYLLNIFSSGLKDVKDRFILFYSIEKSVLQGNMPKCKLLKNAIFVKLPVQYLKKSKKEKLTDINMTSKQVMNESQHDTELMK